jgi:hypothetical protein
MTLKSQYWAGESLADGQRVGDGPVIQHEIFETPLDIERP